MHFEKHLYVLDTSPSSDTWLDNIFYQSVVCFFICMTLLFKDQKFLILIKSNLSIFIFRIMFLVSSMRNLCVIQSHKCFLCFPGRFTAAAFTLGLWPVNGAHYARYRRLAWVFLAHQGSIISTPFVEQAQLSLLSCFCWHFALQLPDGVHQSKACVWVYFWILSFIPLT